MKSLSQFSFSHFPTSFIADLLIYPIASLRQRNNNKYIQTIMIVNQRNISSKYTILKPNYTVSQLKRQFARPHPRCGYELAMKDNIGIRKYKKLVESFDSNIQDYQWRYEQKSPIVHCLYVQLMPSNPKSKNIALQVYVQDLQLSLAKMKKLLLPQAMYLMLRGVRGYKAIWSRYKRISVDQQAIGLDSLGNCLVWLNSTLDKNYADQFNFNLPRDIVRELISLIRGKCQKVTAGVLLQLEQNLSAKENDFQRCQEIILGFVKRYRIKMPNDLRYIINQERLKKNCEDLKVKMNIKEPKDNAKDSKFYKNKYKFDEVIKDSRQIFSRASLASEQMRSPKVISKFHEKERVYTTFRKTLSPNGYYKTFGSKLQETYNNESLDSRKMKNYQHSIEDRRFYESTVAHEPHNYSKVYHSRCKSQSFQLGNFISNIRPKKRQNYFACQQKVQKRCSKQSENIKTAQSFANNSKWSFNSQNSIDTAKKTLLTPSNMIKSTPPQPIDTLYRCKQFQSYQCSPFIIQEQQNPKINPSLIEQDPLQLSNLDSTNEFLLANKWKATVKNLLSTKIHLNKSITDGNDTSNYLSQVKLQKLDTMINKKMAVSLLPQR